MVETADDQAGRSGSRGEREEFDVSTVKEAASLSSVGVVIGVMIALAMFMPLIVTGIRGNGSATPDPAADATIAEEPAPTEDSAAVASVLADVDEAVTSPALLGVWNMSFPGQETFTITINEDGTYFDPEGGGRWTYDKFGVWCFSPSVGGKTFCYNKKPGSNDDYSTWQNVEYPSSTFDLDRPASPAE